ncbi:sigma-70 family RNA polymerase sigma factor [Streptomyces sp. NPDC058548]|uniref:sigma-70 family RNA polymerase sigma factor n=1 Tax=unclassified Streptomyces TaxID=2593676 RepID=UPI00366299D4
MVALGKSVNGSKRSATMDQETLAELYQMHAPYLLRSLLRLTSGDRGKAEDILQETFVRAWQHPEALSRGPEHGRPWLFTVARRIAIDHFRMQSARAQEVADDAPEERSAGRDSYEDVLALHDLTAALAELPDHQREVLEQLHIEDRSVAQAAVVLGIPAGTVKSRHFYAIRALRPVLERRGMLAAM